MRQERRGSPAAAAAGLPASPSRPKRRLHFDLKKMLGLKRGVRTQRLRDGASPIRTRRRVERSMSEPLLLGDQEERPRATEAHQATTPHRDQQQMTERDSVSGNNQALSELIDGADLGPESVRGLPIEINSQLQAVTEGTATLLEQEMESKLDENDRLGNNDMPPRFATPPRHDDPVGLTESSGANEVCAANDYGSDSRLLLGDDPSHGPDNEFRSLIDYAIDSYVDNVSSAPSRTGDNNLLDGSNEEIVTPGDHFDLDVNSGLVNEDSSDSEVTNEVVRASPFTRDGLGGSDHQEEVALRINTPQPYMEHLVPGASCGQEDRFTHDNHRDAHQLGDNDKGEYGDALFLDPERIVPERSMLESSHTSAAWERSDNHSTGGSSYEHNDPNGSRIENGMSRSRTDSTASEQLIVELDEADGRLEVVVGIVQEALSLAESALSSQAGQQRVPLHTVTSSSASPTEAGFSDSGSDGFDLILATDDHSSDCISEPSESASHRTGEELILSSDQAQRSTMQDNEERESLPTNELSIDNSSSRLPLTPCLTRWIAFGIIAISFVLGIGVIVIPFLNEFPHLNLGSKGITAECSTIRLHDALLNMSTNGLTMVDVCEFVADMHPPSERSAFMQSLDEAAHSNLTQLARGSLSESEDVKQGEVYIFGFACTLFIVALVQCG